MEKNSIKKTLENKINSTGGHNLEFVSEDGYDLCVSCRKKTIYKTETPIEQREHYVEGAGQQCGECFLKTYGKN